ncbi:DMT family transporter [Silvanigrella aquatica]|uniref:EamA domain-containing protein n=1 Tax=Silvanigrella aquatica TaxID=1915309 RepID=A0A1L4D0V3_9BACT|nr:DMT family transporter [Silvanigrella aquatica]APJ03843.1 hypothetical protein AXG55_07965 [Silvanigrella aquatica]
MLKQNNKGYYLGVVEMMIANSFVGVNIILNKFLLDKAPLFILLEMRYLFGVVILLFISLFMKPKLQFYLTQERFSNKDWIIYILMALSGGAFFNFIYMLGMLNTTASSVGIISSAIPTLIAIFSFFILKQPLKRVHIFCIILVVLGVSMLNLSRISVNDNLNPDSVLMFVGNLIVFLAMIPEALFTIFAKMVKVKVCPIISGLLINFLNALFCLPFALFYLNKINIFSLDYIVWIFSFCVGLFSGALFYIFYNKGIAKIDANTAALLTGVIPISAATLSIIFLKEPIHITTILGMLFVLMSIYIGAKFSDDSKVLLYRVRQKQ